MPAEFRVLLLERLRLPLPVAIGTCEGCGRSLDCHGHHRGACPSSGRLKKRATPAEKAVARACREAGAVVQANVLLRDMNIGVSAADNRRLEILAQGLPFKAGSQIAVDVTMRSALTSCGQPRMRAAVEDGCIAEAARVDKEKKYPELLEARRCELAVLAMETGGRWSRESTKFIRDLAATRARSVPQLMRGSVFFSYSRRRTRMIAVAAAAAFARSLVLPANDCTVHVADVPAPPTCDVVADARY